MNLQSLNAFIGNQAAAIVASSSIGWDTVSKAYDQQLPIHEQQVKVDQAAALAALMKK